MPSQGCSQCRHTGLGYRWCWGSCWGIKALLAFGVLSCTLQSLFKAVELQFNISILSNCEVIPNTPTQLPRSEVCLLTGILNEKPFCQYCSSQPSWKKNCQKWKSDLRITVEGIYALVGKGSRELQWPDLDQTFASEVVSGTETALVWKTYPWDLLGVLCSWIAKFQLESSSWSWRQHLRQIWFVGAMDISSSQD